MPSWARADQEPGIEQARDGGCPRLLGFGGDAALAGRLKQRGRVLVAEDVALERPAAHTEGTRGLIERLEGFVEQHRRRLEELLRAYGPGSRPASHGPYALIGQPETLVILGRRDTNPSGLRSQ